MNSRNPFGLDEQGSELSVAFAPASGCASTAAETPQVPPAAPSADNRVGFAAILLAAGAAAGRKRPTQLCPYPGGTLIEHAVRTALASGACEVVVVAGEHFDEIQRKLRRLPVRIIQNRDWHEGISSSIRAGISGLKSEPRSAVVCLCDQHRITPAHLRDLGCRVNEQSGPAIVASSYDGVIGAPAAFDRSYFPQLLELKGHAGARQLIRESTSQVETICFDEANDEIEVVTASDPPARPRRRGFASKRVNCVRGARAPPTKWQETTAA